MTKDALAGRRIGFIGAGNMAGALISGLIADGASPQTITAADPSAVPSTRADAYYNLGIAQARVESMSGLTRSKWSPSSNEDSIR